MHFPAGYKRRIVNNVLLNKIFCKKASTIKQKKEMLKTKKAVL